MIRSQTVVGGRALTLLAALALGACGEPQTEGTPAAARLPLRAQVSPVFDVEAFPALQATTYSVTLGCGSTRCLSAYHEPFLELAVPTHILATRIDERGRPLDAPRLRLADGLTVVTVAARDDEFLIQTSSDAGYKFDRVRGSDGALLADVSDRLLQARIRESASTGRTWALSYDSESGTGNSRVRLYDPEFQPIGGEITVPGYQAGSTNALVAGDGQYLIATTTGVSRIDERTGTLLDATPISHCKYLTTGQVRGVYYEGIYYLLCGTGKLYLNRVTKDGVLLEPGDAFNQVPGASLIYDVAARPPYQADIYRIGNELVVPFSQSNGNLYALRIDPTTGLRQNGAATVLPTSIGKLQYDNYRLLPAGGGAVLLDNARQVSGLSPSDTATVLTRGASSPVSAYPGARAWASAASNGSTYFVVFCGNIQFEEISHVYVVRIDPATGAFLDNPPIDLGVGASPAVASDGTNFLVTYFTNGGVGTRLLSPSGTVLGGQIADLGWSLNNAPLDLVSNGAYYAAAYRGAVARIDGSNGTFVDRPPKTLFSAGGDPPVLLADSTPLPERRTFLLVQSTNAGLSAVRMRSQTGVVISPSTLIGSGDTPLGASDGTNLLVVSPVGSIWNGFFVDPVEGLRVPVTALSWTLPGQAAIVGSWYDGASFNLLARRSASDGSSFAFRRFDRELQPLSDDPPGDGEPMAEQIHYAGSLGQRMGIGSSGKGCSLVVYGVYDFDRLGNAVKAQFIDNGSSQPCGASVGIGGSGAGGTGGGDAQAGSGGRTGGSAGQGGVAGRASNSGGQASSSGGRTGTGAGGAATDQAGGASGAAAEDGGTKQDAGGSAGSAADEPSQGGLRTNPNSLGGSTSANGGGAGWGAGANSADAGSANAGSSGSAGASPSADNGCGCRTAPAPNRHSALSAGLLGLLVLLGRRRRRTAKIADGNGDKARAVPITR